MGTTLRELYLYACAHCGTIRSFAQQIPKEVTMHCTSCHHVSIPDVVAIDFKVKKFVAVRNDQT